MKYSNIKKDLFIDNRKNFVKHLKPNSLALFVSNDFLPTNGDGSLGFVQNSDLFYLTGVDQEDTNTINQFLEFGINTGIAFQIKDDLFDFGDDTSIGKPTGIDIKEKKMTLPLIYALNNCTWLEKRKIINIIKNHNDDPKAMEKFEKW